eukprot:CAMPEP_0197629836 /NCGR_PEP_ID=MMETSP1338-20131121/7535_1 /TAXON_ID=43686 ORGANISM="Pelagodinium beii, Strain RCC1491" /NCGR_SAMPLE_ID=MMETSP1338 /ASSEMBLY_ACC=CAM_ASM_000754 /LENGTH=151 /DNA_ID=CAMNT_0043200941 /DNA_START=30 /DNA_END=485 /DNA_ORIENTATION=+
MADGPLLHAGGSGMLASVGQGGALGTHAASAGRAASLKSLGRNLVSDGHEDFIRSWAARPHISSPFATNFDVNEAPLEMRWQGNGLHKAVSLTAERVFHRGGPEGAPAAIAAAAAKHKAATPFHPIRTAGVPSGCNDLDQGRLSLLNARQC